MKQDLTRIYSGADLSGAASGVIYLPIVRTSTMEKVSVRSDAAQIGDAVFEMRKNNVVIAGLSSLTIPNGSKIGTVSGLAIALADGDEITLNFVSGSVSAPVTLSLSTEDGITSGTTLAQNTAICVTASLADTVSENGTAPLGRYALLSKIEANRACRIRLYSTGGYRAADAGRTIGVDPTGEHGVLLDAVLTSDNLTLDLSPVVPVFDGANPRTGNLFYAIQNRSGATGTVTATFTKLTLEA